MLFRCWEAWDISAGMFTCRMLDMFMCPTFTQGTFRMRVGAPHHGGIGGAGGADVPWWNAFSILIFLCWFGAAGYLLTRYGNFVGGVVLVLAAVCGIAGGTIIFLFLTKVLLPHERELTADETDVVGAVGRVSSAIRAGGTGEIVYQQMGAVDLHLRGLMTVSRFKNRKRFTSFDMKRELPTCGAGTIRVPSAFAVGMIRCAGRHAK